MLGEGAPKRIRRREARDSDGRCLGDRVAESLPPGWVDERRRAHEQLPLRRAVNRLTDGDVVLNTCRFDEREHPSFPAAPVGAVQTDGRTLVRRERRNRTDQQIDALVFWVEPAQPQHVPAASTVPAHIGRHLDAVGRDDEWTLVAECLDVRALRLEEKVDGTRAFDEASLGRSPPDALPPPMPLENV